MVDIPRVAIACQGGGSHTAFAAGILRRLLSPDLRQRFKLVALSGTSGGAVCAALTWAGLLSGGPDEASMRLTAFWRDLRVHDLLDAATNFWAVTLARLPVTQEVSPYLYEPVAEPRLRTLLQQHVDLEHLTNRAVTPKLLVGATEILSGDRTIFHGETLTYDDIIASAAVPPLFRAVHIDNKLFWDGLFATNPPVREFTDLAEDVSEIWVIQINPQHRSGEPRNIRDIDDRRNELSGNLSLGQELYFIQKINDLLQKHEVLASKYHPIRVRVVELGIPDLDYPSKLDRSAPFIEHLMENGAHRAPWFFDDRSDWPRPGTVPATSVTHHHPNG
jgi:NTE family protein